MPRQMSSRLEADPRSQFQPPPMLPIPFRSVLQTFPVTVLLPPEAHPRADASDASARRVRPARGRYLASEGGAATGAREGDSQCDSQPYSGSSRSLP